MAHQGQPQQQYYAPPPGPPTQQHQPQQSYPPPPGQPGQQPPGQHLQQQQQHPGHHPQQQQPQHPQQYQQQQLSHAPQSLPQAGSAQPAHPSDTGAFHGGQYSVSHRDTNAVLNINLQQGASVRSKSGAMIHMSGSVQLTGKVKFSMRKLFTGGEMAESTYLGPGRVALGPTLFGDIITLHIDGRTPWIMGKGAFLACTPDVTKEVKAQGIGKTMFSGEDLFVYRLGGQGIVWLTSFGAVDRLDVCIAHFAREPYDPNFVRRTNKHL